MTKFASIFHCPSNKSQCTFSPPRVIPVRMLRKKEHNVDKKEVLQAHVGQIQTLQNELESLRAQLANLKGKSSQPASHAQPIQGSRSREGPPRSFYGLSHNAMVGEYVLSSAHNSILTPKFCISFCPSYFTAQEASVAPRVSTTRQVIQTDGFAFNQVLLLGLEEFEQSCHNFFLLSTQKKNAPCWQGGKRLLHQKLLGH